MGGLIQMIINQVMRHFVRRGVDAGINHLTGGRKPRPGLGQSNDAKDLARKARQAANLARRMGR